MQFFFCKNIVVLFEQISKGVSLNYFEIKQMQKNLVLYWFY